MVAKKRPDRPRETWDEVLVNDRKKLVVDSADPQNEDAFEEDLSKQTQPSVEEN